MPEVISLGLALFFAWLFAVAGVHKIRFGGYYRDLLGTWFGQLPGLAAAVPVLAIAELLLALALVLPGAGLPGASLPGARPAGLLAAAMLLLLYAALMGVQMASGRQGIKCGCSGPASDVTISPALLLRNLACASLALLALLPGASSGGGFAAGGMALGIAVFMVLSYLVAEQMIANAQQMAGK